MSWCSHIGTTVLLTAVLTQVPRAPQPSTPLECLSQNGLAYGPFRDGQSADVQIYPRVEQIDEDLAALRFISRRIRTYSATQSLGEIPRIARKYGIRVSQGIHLEPPITPPQKEANEAQIAAALNLAKQGLVESLIVGNETLTLDKFPKAQLVAYIRRVKSGVPKGVTVTTAEMFQVWQSHLDLAGEVDFVLAHFYPFWDRHSIDGAAARLPDVYRTLRRDLRDKYPNRNVDIVIGETGWPAAGDPRGNAKPSAENQRRFFEDFTAVACANAIPFYYFEAFDEEWKWGEGSSGSGGTGQSAQPPSAAPPPGDHTFSGRTVGSSWGLFQSDGGTKRHFANLVKWRPPPTRAVREIFVGPRLAAFYDMGIDSSHRQREWVAIGDGEMRMLYPANQEWGVVFVTVRKPTDRQRSWKDYSTYDFLVLELRGETGVESVEIGIKDRFAPDDGKERKVRVSKLGTQYRPYTFPLAGFASPRFRVPQDLDELYVVVEFVFSGTRPQTIYARNIRYTRTENR